MKETKQQRRERIATAVLAGFASTGANWSPNECAPDAVEYADALIAALDAADQRDMEASMDVRF